MSENILFILAGVALFIIVIELAFRKNRKEYRKSEVKQIEALKRQEQSLNLLEEMN